MPFIGNGIKSKETGKSGVKTEFTSLFISFHKTVYKIGSGKRKFVNRSKKVCKYRSSMIMMGERLENKLFALALCIAVTDGYVKHSRHLHSILGSIPTNVLHT